MKNLPCIVTALFSLVLCHYAEKVGSTQCYNCIGNCTEPVEVVSCGDPDDPSADWLCWTVESNVGNKTGVMKGCVENTEKTQEICNTYNSQEGISCYTCNTDLCNDKNTLGGVQQCYTCQDDCSDLDIEECPKICGTEYVCMSYKFLRNDTITIQKGCVPKLSGVTDLCENVNEEESSCYTCETDLCNEKNDLSLKCYFCEDTCDDPLEVEECPSECGQEYGCMSYQFKRDNTTVIQKSCVPVVPRVTELCENAEQNGGSCYICDESFCNEQNDPNRNST